MAAALAIGTLVNALVLMALGGLTVYHFVATEETVLEAPLTLAPIEPTTVRYNMKKAQDRQKLSQLPRQQQIKARSVADIVTPELEIDLDGGASPRVSVSTLVDVQTFGSASLGPALRMGVSAVDFFGIKSKGERVVIILDIAKSMLDPKRGDITGFVRVKERLGDIVSQFNSATLFNVMVFSEGLDVMSSNLVIANSENKERAKAFIDPYWKAEGGRFAPGAKKSVFLKNYTPQYVDVIPLGGSSRMDMALLAAFEQGADAIFVITDGTPSFTRSFDAEEQKVYDARLAEYERLKAETTPEELAVYKKAREKALAYNRSQREANAQDRESQGLDKAVTQGGVSTRTVTAPWGAKPRSSVTVLGNDEFVGWAKLWAIAHYGDAEKNLPAINLIGYSIPDSGTASRFLTKLRDAFPKGQFEVFGEYDS